MRFKAIRSWIGIGLVAALGLGVAGALTLRANAASGTSDSTFVAMPPCRLFDTRPEYNVGLLVTFGSDETQTASAHGDNGECTIPTDAVALSLNVTAVNATLPTHVTVWPGGVMPTASSLNPAPGGVAFNAVTVSLASGAFRVYNLQGTVDVITDVNGYYRASTVDDLETRLARAEAAQPVVASRLNNAPQVIDGTQRTILLADVPKPVALTGKFVANYSVNIDQDEAGVVVECRLANNWWLGPAQRWESPGSPGGSGHISGTALFDWDSEFSLPPYPPADPIARLLCQHSGASRPTIATSATVNMTFYPEASPP